MVDGYSHGKRVLHDRNGSANVGDSRFPHLIKLDHNKLPRKTYIEDSMKNTLTDASMYLDISKNWFSDRWIGDFSDFPRTSDQRVYHLGLRPGEVANRIVSPRRVWIIQHVKEIYAVPDNSRIAL
jgi:hypothetical protein